MVRIAGLWERNEHLDIESCTNIATKPSELLATIVRKMAERAAIETSGLSGQSLRAGMCQDLVAAGYALSAIVRTGRWRSSGVAARYSAHLLGKQEAEAQFQAE